MSRINNSIHLVFLALVISVFLAKVAGAEPSSQAAAPLPMVACSAR